MAVLNCYDDLLSHINRLNDSDYLGVIYQNICSANVDIFTLYWIELACIQL